MARQPSGTGSAEESSDAPAEGLDSGAEVVDEGNVVDDEIDDELDGDEAAGRTDTTDALWAEVRMQPVEIALPAGIGYTLRAYRLSTDVLPPDLADREDDYPTRPSTSPFDEELDEREALSAIDEDELTAQALAAGREKSDDDGADGVDDDADDDDARGRHRADDEDGSDEPDDEVDTEDAEESAEAEESEDTAVEDEPEEVPVFLSKGGRLLLFRSADGLVEFVRSGTDNELTQLDTWGELAERLEADDVIPLDEDRYELDLVVENLRGGHDVWDAPLIIQAGEVARDVGYALRIQPVMDALSTGSPLDDMDEGLRTVEEGGFGSFFARRKLRKIDAQTTAALGWRTIIGKISAVVDWRN